jgi:2-phosphoglycerate kinase
LTPCLRQSLQNTHNRLTQVKEMAVKPDYLGFRPCKKLKTIVINETDNTRIPFLRGILTRSLLEAGLKFEQAFELATVVRDELSETGVISSDDLTQRVSQLLSEMADEDTQDLYRVQTVALARIQVISLSGTVSAFSRGRHARYLQSSGMKAEKAEQTTALIHDHLLVSGVSSITTCQLGYLTYLCLQQEVSKKAAKRYLVWSEFQRSARPLLLLICGTVGSGKSTIATEVAHLLEIVRIQSTDMLREVMRMMMPKKLLPVLHSSSFNAWKSLPVQGLEHREKEQLVAEGYRSQVDLLAVPCEAVLQRAVEESVPIILEGVHAHPDLLSLAPDDSDAIMVHVTLAVLKSGELKSRLRGRGIEVPQRRAKRYLNKFDSIWSLQTFLLTEADRCDVPIITNSDMEKAVVQIIHHVNYKLSKHFSSPPDVIFGPVVEEMKEQVGSDAWQEILPSLSD